MTRADSPTDDMKAMRASLRSITRSLAQAELDIKAAPTTNSASPSHITQTAAHSSSPGREQMTELKVVSEGGLEHMRHP